MTVMRILIFILIASSVGTVNAQLPRSGLPSALWSPADAHDCDDLTDFFEYVDTLDPPYVFGIIDGSYSAVFLCRWRDDDLQKLVFWRVPGAAPPPPQLSCPSTIVQRNVIGGGLSLEHRRVNLSQLYYLDANQEEPFEPQWTPGPNTEIETTVIHASRGGVGTRFVCHQGRWLYANLD
jgi:hypothetical protein